MPSPSIRAHPREAVYHGPYLEEAPDILVDFAPGYRISWSSSMGGVAEGQFEDNVKKWSGDHIIDPDFVPGVLFMNRPFRRRGARLLDLAPTILAALGVAQRYGDGRRLALAMKILVLGLDFAAPELLFGYDDLPNIRRLMEVGAYGRLESVIPPITVPAWMCLATSQDPGLAGYLRLSQPGRPLLQRPGYRLARSITEPAIWDHLAREGKRSIIVGVPPGYPPDESMGSPWAAF